MAVRVTVRVEGLRELGLRMQKLSDKVAKRVSGQATNAGAQVVKKEAKANIRSSPSVETGTLLDAVIVKKLRKRDSEGLTSAHIVTVRKKKTGRKTKSKQTTAPHAIFVEYGTVNMPAEPFLRPAFEKNKGRAVDAIKAKLAQGITKAGA